ncbi:hypothetical protein QN365_23830, partial [Pseudomonas sp. RTI1]|nr:hypothetical protein [Pseudomonas sp. RTI1]
MLFSRGDVKSIQLKVADCLQVALNAFGGADTQLGKDIHNLSDNVRRVETLAALVAPLTVLKD